MEKERTCYDCQYCRVCGARRECGDTAWCCSTYSPYIDREALLKIADEIDADGDKLLEDESLLVGAVGLMHCYANSIREALGENNDN